jgi:hypothetical protein
LCQITSKSYGDAAAISIGDGDFAIGSLHVPSCARPGKLFTASAELVVSVVGALKHEAHARIVESIVALLRKDCPI